MAMTKAIERALNNLNSLRSRLIDQYKDLSIRAKSGNVGEQNRLTN